MIRCWRIFVTIALLLIFTLGEAVVANNDVRTEVENDLSQKKVEVATKRQVVYGLTLFNGFGYQGTFCPEEIETIYMIGNSNNAFTINMTDVYFWPITKEYKADWQGFNQRMEGTLEILQNNKVIKTFAMKRYTLYYPDSSSNEAKELIFEKKAELAVKDFKDKSDAFNEAIFKYYQANEDYNNLVKKFFADPSTFKNKFPPKPTQPIPPAGFYTDLEQGFIINLPVGKYLARLKDPQGKVVAKSEKELISFPALSKGVGYDIIPEEKWTAPTKSDDLSENVFALKNQVVYLKPFHESQYNGYNYTKLTQLTKPISSRGLENQKIWIHNSPLTARNFSVEVIRDKRLVARITEKPYYVKQRPGYALGYDVVEFNTQEFPDATPTFQAYKIIMPKDSGRYYLRLVDQKGRVIAGSIRKLQTIRQPRLLSLLLISFLPMIVAVIVIGRRRLMFRKSPSSVEIES